MKGFLNAVLGAAALSFSGVLAVDESACFFSMENILLPNLQFDGTPDTTSEQSASTVQNCGKQYPECFTTQGVNYVTDPGFTYGTNGDIPAVCREAMRFTIPVQISVAPSLSPTKQPTVFTSAAGSTCANLPKPSPAFGDSGNSASTDPCACQFATSFGKTRAMNISMRMTTQSCCQQCSCVGDPHCYSFSGGFDNWVTCNAREPDTCEISSSLCNNHPFWMGVTPCRYYHDGKGNSGCQPDASYPDQPLMTMYSKTYLDSTTSQYYDMSIVLQLGNLGNIVCVTASYGPTQSAPTTVYKICTPLYGGGSASSNTNIGITEGALFSARTKVSWLITVRNVGGVSERLEIVLNDLDTTQVARGGFCQTSKIVEKEPYDAYDCNPSDAFTYRALCNQGFLQDSTQCAKNSKKTNVVSAQRTKWCKNYLSPAAAAACINAPVGQWFVYVCVRLYPNNPAGQTNCQSRFKEVPSEVVAELKPLAPSTTTFAPTVPPTPCPSLIGLHPAFSNNPKPGTSDNLGRPVSDAYLFYQKYDPISSTWGYPLVWWTKAQLQCGQLFPITQSAPFANLMDSGATYRLLQCQRPADICGQKVVEVDIDVKYYQNPVSDGAVSKQLGTLFYTGDVVCNKSKYPLCPNEYKCCMWGPDAIRAWTQCMKDNHAAFYNNPAHPCAPI